MARDPWDALSGPQRAGLLGLTIATYGTACHLCGGLGADSVDHVLPRSRGGSNAIANLRPAHRSCNYARADKTLEEWFATHPRPRATAPLPPSRAW